MSTRFFQDSVVLTREPPSFWRENVIAVVNSRLHSDLLRVLACGGNKLSNVRSFIILLSGEGLSFFSINNRTDVLVKKK